MLKAAKIRDTVFFKYTIEHILSLFAKDIASNVAFMVTRTDNKDPPLKEIIMSLDTAIECTGERFFCFNDSGSFDPDAGDTVVENGFELGTACFDNFFKNLANRKDVATRSSATVIEQIRKLEELAEFLQKAVRDLLSVLDLNKQIKSKIAQLDEKMLDSNPYKKKPFTDREHFVTNCTQCYRTCHYPCGIRKVRPGSSTSSSVLI